MCPQGKMPQQFVVRLFVSFECVDFERGSLLTFESATPRSFLLVVLFSRAKFVFAAHFLVGLSPFFCIRQNSLHH